MNRVKRSDAFTLYAMVLVAVAAVALLALACGSADAGIFFNRARSAEIYACPNIIASDCPGGVCPREGNGFRDRFGRKPKPDQPAPDQPQTPAEPPKFDFPGGEVPADPAEPAAPESPKVEIPAGVDEAGMRDWTPEQWEKFFNIIMLFISALSGAGILQGAKVYLRKRAEKLTFADVPKRVAKLKAAANAAEAGVAKAKQIAETIKGDA